MHTVLDFSNFIPIWKHLLWNGRTREKRKCQIQSLSKAFSEDWKIVYFTVYRQINWIQLRRTEGQGCGVVLKAGNASVALHWNCARAKDQGAGYGWAGGWRGCGGAGGGGGCCASDTDVPVARGCQINLTLWQTTSSEHRASICVPLPSFILLKFGLSPVFHEQDFYVNAKKEFSKLFSLKKKKKKKKKKKRRKIFLMPLGVGGGGWGGCSNCLSVSGSGSDSVLI